MVPCMRVVFDPGESLTVLHTDGQDVAFRTRGRRRHSRHGYFRGSIHGLHVPLLTLRTQPCGWPRIARGRHGSLLLCRTTLAFAPSRRLVSALPPLPRRHGRWGAHLGLPTALHAVGAPLPYPPRAAAPRNARGANTCI